LGTGLARIGSCIDYAISGIELIHGLRKGQLILTALGLTDSVAPAVGFRSSEHNDVALDVPLAAPTAIFTRALTPNFIAINKNSILMHCNINLVCTSNYVQQLFNV